MGQIILSYSATNGKCTKKLNTCNFIKQLADHLIFAGARCSIVCCYYYQCIFFSTRTMLYTCSFVTWTFSFFFTTNIMMMMMFCVPLPTTNRAFMWEHYCGEILIKCILAHVFDYMLVCKWINYLRFYFYYFDKRLRELRCVRVSVWFLNKYRLC